MTLEKPPRGKPVKRKFIMELLEKYYSREIKHEEPDLLQPTYLKFGSKFLLEVRSLFLGICPFLLLPSCLGFVPAVAACAPF
jgi:hypothetical protein